MSSDRLLRLPLEDTKENYLAGFWRWVGLMAANDYEAAVEAIYWPANSSRSAEVLSNRVTTFFGGSKPWSVVIPNQRLVDVVTDAAEFQPPRSGLPGWLLAHIPLTTEPSDPKSDSIPLMGLGRSFLLRESAGSYVLEFEIFHA